jgi:hypothetical protein
MDFKAKPGKEFIHSSLPISQESKQIRKRIDKSLRRKRIESIVVLGPELVTIMNLLHQFFLLSHLQSDITSMNGKVPIIEN